MPFPFEQLDVYKKSLSLVDSIESLIASLHGKASRPLLDQLSRAALSIPLNIAEGNGRWHQKDKRQFFWIARGSAFECIPILQILGRKELIPPEEYQRHYALLEIIAKMLTNLVKSVERLTT